MAHYDIEFYEDDRGNCPVADWLRELDRANSKETRCMLKKVFFQIERLQNEGLGVGEPIVKRLDEDVWELRPIPNRILFGVMKEEILSCCTNFASKAKGRQSMKLNRQNVNINIGSSEVRTNEMV